MTPHRTAARLAAYSLQPWLWWMRLVGEEVAGIAIRRNQRNSEGAEG